MKFCAFLLGSLAIVLLSNVYVNSLVADTVLDALPALLKELLPPLALGPNDPIGGVGGLLKLLLGSVGGIVNGLLGGLLPNQTTTVVQAPGSPNIAAILPFFISTLIPKINDLVSNVKNQATPSVTVLGGGGGGQNIDSNLLLQILLPLINRITASQPAQQTIQLPVGLPIGASPTANVIQLPAAFGQLFSQYIQRPAADQQCNSPIAFLIPACQRTQSADQCSSPLAFLIPACQRTQAVDQCSSPLAFLFPACQKSQQSNTVCTGSLAFLLPQCKTHTASNPFASNCQQAQFAAAYPQLCSG